MSWTVIMMPSKNQPAAPHKQTVKGAGRVVLHNENEPGKGGYERKLESGA
jgi:hypothetical protein